MTLLASANLKTKVGKWVVEVGHKAQICLGKTAIIEVFKIYYFQVTQLAH